MTLEIFIFGAPFFWQNRKYTSQSILTELQVSNDDTHYVNEKSNHPTVSHNWIWEKNKTKIFYQIFY